MQSTVKTHKIFCVYLEKICAEHRNQYLFGCKCKQRTVIIGQDGVAHRRIIAAADGDDQHTVPRRTAGVTIQHREEIVLQLGLQLQKRFAVLGVLCAVMRRDIAFCGVARRRQTVDQQQDKRRQEYDAADRPDSFDK